MFKRPQLRAVTIVLIGIIVGVLVNLATSAFDVSRWRWWLVAVVVLVGTLWAAIEFWAARSTSASSATTSPPHWLLPSIEEPVERPALTGALSGLLVDDGIPVVGVTTALYGAGGFGKTTLVVQVCSLEDVRAKFIGGLLWATIGMDRKGAELAAIVNDLSAQIAGERPQFSDPEQAGRHLGQLLDALPPNLLVIDDIWTADQLRPFMFAGTNTTRLVTTRNPASLPSNAKTVRVDEMQGAESQELISRGLPALPARTVAQVLRLTGNWPLLLAMVNRAIHGYVKDGVGPADATLLLAEQLAVEGPAFLDVRIEASRDRAVRLTVAASLRLLPEPHGGKFHELGIFAEDADIPLATLGLLWRMTDTQTRRLCEDLAGLSLVKAYQRGPATLQLHDVIRDHLRHELDDRLPAVNAELLDAVRSLLPSAGDEWWRLPSDAIYLWRHLSFHLAEANEYAKLKALICDLRWAEEKIRRFGLAAYESDLVRVADPTVDVLRRALARKGHLLGPIQPAHSHADLLISRLGEIPELRGLVAAYSSTLPTDVARLTNRWSIPPVDPALLRVLADHSDSVTGCAIAPDGRWLATTSADHNTRVWDASSEHDRGAGYAQNRSVTSCEIAPDAGWLVAVGAENIGCIWDVDAPVERVLLRGHTDIVTGCAIAPDGRWLATTSADRTVRIWDTSTWEERVLLPGHSDIVTGCAIAPDGRWLATTSADRTVRIWDTSTWAEQALLPGHSDTVTGCAIAPDGRWLATTSADRTVRIWDTDTWEERVLLRGHSDIVTGCAIAPDGRWLATTGGDIALRIWETATWRPAAAMRTNGRPNDVCWFPDSTAVCVGVVGGIYQFTFTPARQLID